MASRLLAALLITSLAFLYLPHSAYAAGIAFDKSGSVYTGAGTTSTVTLAATNANEVAVIFVRWGTGTSHAPTNFTVGGSATGVTQIGTDFTSSDGTYKYRAYYYLNPSTSSTAYQATFNNTSDDNTVFVLLYSSTSQTSQPDSSNTGSGASPLTLSTTVITPNSWLVSSARDRSGSTAAGTGSTLRENPTGALGSAEAGDSNGAVGAGSQSMGWTGAGTVGGFIVSITPVSTTAATTEATLWINNGMLWLNNGSMWQL